MVTATDRARDAMRRESILRAALECFLNFGYAKTSLDDIAKRAGISRPLIYLKYKNKEDVYAAVFEYVFEGRYPRAEAAASAPGRKPDRLLRVFEILLLEPWDEMVGAPKAAEFYEACAKLHPEVEARYQRVLLKCTKSVLGNKELSELFILAVEGIQADLPPTRVLRRRLALLVERFTR